MICGNKKDITEFKPYVSERLYKALAYLATTDFSKVENGEYEIEGRTIFARVSTYETADKAAKKSESHNDYIDVQYLGRGSEKIYYCPKTAAHQVSEDYAESKDLLFYANVEEKDCVTLGEGIFAVFCPWELHRPGCNAGAEPAPVQKIVVKVLAE